jgi:hypothetical protein
MHFTFDEIGDIMYTLISIIVAGAVHEFGHWLTARLFGKKITFTRKGFRFLWTMPEGLTSEQQQIVAIAGFTLELLFALPLLIFFPLQGICYQAVVDVHFIAYQFYAGESNDFNWSANRRANA